MILRSTRFQPGLTLVELLVVITLFSVVVTLTLSAFFNIQRTNKKIEDRYIRNEETSRVIADIGNSLRSAQKLVTGTTGRIVFLDNDGDTCAYYLNNDTLYRNSRPLTNKLVVESLSIAYAGIKDGIRITDFSVFDRDLNGMLQAAEFAGISGISVRICFKTSQKFQEEKISKTLFITLRNRW